jgi:hypothetical protein
VLTAREEALDQDADTGDSEDVASNVQEYRKLIRVFLQAGMIDKLVVILT